MKKDLETISRNYANEKIKFRKNILKEVDADNYGSRHANCMEDFKAGYNYKWISIYEQFPNDNSPVLCSSIYGKMILCWDELSRTWRYPENHDFYCDWNKIDYWMIIPEI